MDQMFDIDEILADGNSTIISGGNGEQMLRTVGDTVNIADREYYQKAMSGTIYVSDIQVSKSTGSRITTFAVPVYNEDETEIIGIVQRNYNLSDFYDLIKGEVTEEKQEIVMVDRNGDLVAHSGHEISADASESQAQNPFYTDSRGDKISGTYKSPWAGETWLISWVKEPKTGWVIASCRVQSVALRHVTTTVFILVLIGIVSLGAGIVIAFMMANSFTKPVEAINESLSALAEGRFLPVKGFSNRRDEFGTMVSNNNAVIEKLRSIVSAIKDGAVSVGESSGELAETASQISQTADGVSEAIQEIATGATQQADEIQQATENTGKISENIQHVSTNAADLETTADNMSGNSKDSAEQLEKLKLSSEQVSVAIREISDSISATSAAVENISTRVAEITSIASQTNLLALNASIEAARAGEAGKGFAVVAEEIGKLAVDSSQSANEIRAEMDILLNESQGAVKKADEVRRTTEEQKKILDPTVHSIDNLISDINTTVSGVKTITTAAEACSDSKGVVADAMGSLSAISEENAASSEETSASMQELNAKVTTLAQAASNLKEISDRLNSEIAFFQS